MRSHESFGMKIKEETWLYSESAAETYEFAQREDKLLVGDSGQLNRWGKKRPTLDEVGGHLPISKQNRDGRVSLEQINHRNIHMVTAITHI